VAVSAAVASVTTTSTPSAAISEIAQVPRLQLPPAPPQQLSAGSPTCTDTPQRQRARLDLRQRLERRLAEVEEATKKRAQKAEKAGKAGTIVSAPPGKGPEGSLPSKADRASDVQQRRQLLDSLRREYDTEHRSSARRALRADSSDEEGAEKNG